MYLCVSASANKYRCLQDISVTPTGMLLFSEGFGIGGKMKEQEKR